MLSGAAAVTAGKKRHTQIITLCVVVGWGGGLSTDTFNYCDIVCILKITKMFIFYKQFSCKDV